MGTGHPLLMDTPFTSEPHCLGEDSLQGHPGHHDWITDGETEAQTREADPGPLGRWVEPQGVGD